MLDLTKIRFQYITNSNEKYSHIDGAKFALDGGCQWIQLRIKIEKNTAQQYDNMQYEKIISTAFELKELCKKYDAIFIVDDYVEIAKEVEADGVHLGKNDMPIKQAREILGVHFIIGGTANTVNDILDLSAKGVDYIGLGPFRFTDTKKNLSEILGIEGYEKIFSELRQLEISTSLKTSIPIIAIGGITKDDIFSILKTFSILETKVITGITGVAVSGAIFNSVNPVQEASIIKKYIFNTPQKEK